MGEELADKSVQGKITNKEWKTPALWGIGLTKSVNPRATFLHDGRADNSSSNTITWWRSNCLNKLFNKKL